MEISQILGSVVDKTNVPKYNMYVGITIHIYNLAKWIELVPGIMRPSPECFPNCRPAIPYTTKIELSL